jgi:hypothetical protein
MMLVNCWLCLGTDSQQEQSAVGRGGGWAVTIRVIACDLSSADVILDHGTKLSAGEICLFAVANLDIEGQIDVELIDSLCNRPIRVIGVIRNRLVYSNGVEFLIDHPADRQQVTKPSRSFGGHKRSLVPIIARSGS